MRKLIFAFIIASLFASCTKQVGEGGLNTIEGVLYIQRLSPSLEKVGSPYPAQDKDVFIHYGDSKKVDDNTSTASNGYFSFEYLTKGDYTIFAYSDDTSSLNNSTQLTITKAVSLDSKQANVSADTLIVYKHVDYDQGQAILTGTVDKIFVGSSNPQPETPYQAQNEEVFLVHQNDKGLVDRVRTTYNGEYKFTNVLPGNYMVYVLSEQFKKDIDSIDSVLVTVTEDSKVIELSKLTSLKF